MAYWDGKVALVTGGSSGIGRATALVFARQGVRVVVTARREQEGQETVALIREAGSEGLFVQTDVTVADQVEALVARTLETYGRLDCAFNNAGMGKSSLLTELSEADWDAQIAVNLKAVWLCLKYELPALQRSGGGAIVNMSSQGALLGIAGYGAYGAAKGGVISLTRAAAAEGAPHHIRVNSIAPGAVRTDLWRDAPAGMLEQVAAGIPLGRVAEADDIASLVMYLCSDQAAFITGQNIPIDGGFTTIQSR